MWEVAITCNSSKVCSEVLGKLHSFLMLLPELEMPILATSYYKFCSLCYLHMCDIVSMHVTLLIHLCTWEALQMCGLKVQDLKSKQGQDRRKVGRYA